MLGKAVAYADCAVMIVRTEETAEDSFAAMRARIRLGIAMAAIISIIATTISNSISENPLFLSIKQRHPKLWYRTVLPSKTMHPGGHSAASAATCSNHGEKVILKDAGEDWSTGPGGLFDKICHRLWLFTQENC